VGLYKKILKICSYNSYWLPWQPMATRYLHEMKFEQLLKPFTQGSILPCLVEIGLVVLHKKIFSVHFTIYITHIQTHTQVNRYMPPHRRCCGCKKKIHMIKIAGNQGKQLKQPIIYHDTQIIDPVTHFPNLENDVPSLSYIQK
jgi:hypothetical protein